MTPVTSLLKVLLTTWPASLPLGIILFLFIIPGLMSDQANEILLKYGDPGRTNLERWPPILLTVLLTTFYGSLLYKIFLILSLQTPKIADDVRRYCIRPIAFLFYFLPSWAVALALFNLKGQGAEFDNYETSAICFLFSPVLFLLVIRGLWRNPPSISRISDISIHPKSLFVFGIFLIVFFAVVGNSLPYVGSVPIEIVTYIGSINVFLLFLFMFSFYSAFIVSLSKSLKLPIITALTVVAVANSAFNLNDNHAVTLVPGKHEEWLRFAFDSWIHSRPDLGANRNYHVLLISAEGGGIRAAYFTALTLARIADRCPKALPHIFAISGVSGGALGATLFAGAIAARPPNIHADHCDMRKIAPPLYENDIGRIFSDDHLAPLLGKMLFNDTLQQLVPLPVYAFDRQRGLEASISYSFLKSFNSSILDTSITRFPSDSGNLSVPFLFINTTEVQSGRRVAISPLTLGDFNLNADWYQQNSPSLISAAGLSARFPFISPAGFAEHGPYVYRYVDGGYTDNSGAVTLRDIGAIINGESDGNPPFLIRALHIGSSPACYQNPETEEDDCEDTYSAPTAGGLGELMSPLTAVVNARNAQVEYNLDALKALITPQLGVSLLARVQLYSRQKSIPLGWSIAGQTMKEIQDQLDDGLEECVDVHIDSNGCNLYWVVEEMVNERLYF